MPYASPMKIVNGLVLDFTVDNADTAADTFLGLNASGEVTKFASVPRTRVSGGGNITESTSSVLTITGGAGSVLTSGLTIQVLQAGAAQSGYLSTTDWNTFNNKLGTSLTSGYIYVGNGSNVATGVAVSGDITISNAGVAAIASGAIVNADINASAAIAVSKLAAVTASRVLGSDGSGFIQALNTATYPSLTELAYVKGVTGAIQTQLNNRLTVTLTSPTSGDVITYDGAAWVNSPSGAGVPSGGTTAQILRKIDGSDYNTEWHTLVAADLTDVSSTAAELNLLDGVTTTTAQFNFLNTVSGNVQDQIDSKQSIALTENNIWVGNASNIATALAAGTNGYVLTSVSGVPTWVSPGVGGTVTSVAVSGGTTGLTTTGGPITTSGTITLTGTLAIANGGTGLTALGTANQLLRVNAGATALEYFTPSYLADPMTTRGDIIIRNASNVTARLPIGTATYVLTSDGTDVAWAAPTGGGGTWGSITGTLSSQTDLQTALDAKLFKAGDTYTTTTGNGLDITSSTVTSGNLVNISTTGTAATSSTKTALNVASSGANASSGQTVYGIRSILSNTGTTSKNSNYFEATGATTNYAIEAARGVIFSGIANSVAGDIQIATTGSAAVGRLYGYGDDIRFSRGGTDIWRVNSTNTLQIPNSNLALGNTRQIQTSNSRTLLYVTEDSGNAQAVGNFFNGAASSSTGAANRYLGMFLTSSKPTAVNTDWALMYVSDANGAGTASHTFRSENNVESIIGALNVLPSSTVIGSSSITANTRLDVNGVSSGSILRLANSSNTERFDFLDDGSLEIAGSAGTSGQVLTSQGTGAAPVWSTIGATGVTEALPVDQTGYTGGSVITSVYDGSELSDGESIRIDVQVILTQTSGTPGASAVSFTLSGAFRKSGGTLTQVGTSDQTNVKNDTGDSFTGTPSLTVNAGAVAVDLNLSTSKTFKRKYFIKVYKN